MFPEADCEKGPAIRGLNRSSVHGIPVLPFVLQVDNDSSSEHTPSVQARMTTIEATLAQVPKNKNLLPGAKREEGGCKPSSVLTATPPKLSLPEF